MNKIVRAGQLAVMAIALVGCGGKHGTLEVAIAVPVDDDPFLDAALVHLKVGDPAIAERTADVSDGHFSTSLKFTLKSGMAGAVLVEAIGADGAVVGRGRSPVVTMSAVQTSITVWVGRLGVVGLSDQALARGRADVAAANIPAVGAVLAGGSVDGVPVADVDVYDIFSHVIATGAPLGAGRTGAVALGYQQSNSTTGAAILAAGGTPAPASDLQSFDPMSGSGGLWHVVASDPSLARLSPSTARLANGAWLLNGGLDGDGNALDSAAMITVGSNQVSAAPSMVVPRVGQVTLAGSFAGDEGALIFGGTADGNAVAERFVFSSSSFAPVDLPGIASRSHATASYLADGRVLILGGEESSGVALASGILLAPSTLEAETVDNLLSTPRSHHVAFSAGGEIVICGGLDHEGQVSASCDVLDPVTLGLARNLSLAVPRRDLQAVTLDNGDVLLAGGIGIDGQPSAVLEIYTPLN